jgi:hypothetical protein
MPANFLKFPSHTLAASLLLSLAWLVAGCKSTPPGPSASLAFIEIQGKTSLEIARTVSEVFKEANYVSVRPPANRDMTFIFEKQGTTGDLLMYGDWSPNAPWYRVKLSIRTLDPQTELVECDVYRVVGHGDARFEEETKLSRFKKGTYQDLLNRVKERLTGSSPG